MARSTGARPSATRPGRTFCPDAGQVVWIDLDPTKGREQQGRRPAIVLSSYRYNSRAELCLACPITRQAKGYPFEVPIEIGRKVGGVVLADQVRSLAWPTRSLTLITVAPAGLVDEVREKLATLLDID
jgi:mRNA interferase MazF